MPGKEFLTLNKEDIAYLFKQERARSGKTIGEVVGLLKDRGIVISATTLYGYENGVSTPKVKLFLALCDIYGITDIMAALGLSPPHSEPAGTGADGLSAGESILVHLFRSIPEDRQEMVLGMIEAALKSQGLL